MATPVILSAAKDLTAPEAHGLATPNCIG
jgi:hypothetical protein